MSIPDDVDVDRLAEAALGLLWLGAHGDRYGMRVWKGMDWDVMNVLHERGWIGDPRSKSKSVPLTEEGKALAEKFLAKHFGTVRK